MPTLRQLLDAHAPLLVLDAASSGVQVGWLANGEAPRWTSSPAEAGIAVFENVERLGIDPGAARGFVFCDGPGSILGIRTTAMALRTWCVQAERPVFAYHSLSLLVETLRRPDLTVIADARRETWHRATLGSTLARVSAAELGGPLAMPENFRAWSAPPGEVERVPYHLPDLFAAALTLETDVFRATPAPDAFLHEEPSYVTWTPQIHRAP